MVDASLDIDRLIERRSNGHDDKQQALEALWAGSVRAYNRRRQEEHRLAWAEFHTGQAARHRRALEELVRYHEAEAQKLMSQLEGAA